MEETIRRRIQQLSRLQRVPSVESQGEFQILESLLLFSSVFPGAKWRTKGVLDIHPRYILARRFQSGPANKVVTQVGASSVSLRDDANVSNWKMLPVSDASLTHTEIRQIAL